VQAGFPVGLLLANLVFLVSVRLEGDWAWRVPFLFSIVLVAIGMFIRARVRESPVFEDVKEAGEIVKSPLVEVIKSDWRNIVRGICLRIAETAGYAVAVTYMMSYITSQNLGSKSDTIFALSIASAMGVVATISWARLTDFIGRRPQYIVVTLFNMLWAAPMFLLVNTANIALIIAIFNVSYCVSQNALAGSQGTWFPELFNANIRFLWRCPGLPDFGDDFGDHTVRYDDSVYPLSMVRSRGIVFFLLSVRFRCRPADARNME